MSDGPNLRRAGPYRITGLLGSGGSASIYAAQDTNDQEVALKVFSHQHDRWLERFTQEANHLKHIDHPNVVRMIEAGIDGHLAYLAMELIHGHDLTASNTLRERQNWPEIVRIGVEICNGLNAIHQAHLIHRDIKPSNVMLGNDGRVVITDFGLVRNEDHEASVSEDGKIIGTPAYLAPEQVSQHLCPLSPLTDIYGVAGCLYYLITGHAPNHGNTLWAILSSIISEPFPDPTAITPHCPPRLAELILRAGNKIPEQRFESASELAMALTECKLGQSTVTTAIPTIDAEPPDQLTKPAVLLIDDDPVIRKIYSALLSKQGCKLSVGNNCQEARTKLQTEHYRMVILDLLLGDGHGSELIPLIKQTQPHECSIVILSDLAGQSLDGFDVTTALCKWTTTPRRVIERVMNILSGRLDLANDLLAPPPDDDVHARASGPQPPSEPDLSENELLDLGALGVPNAMALAQALRNDQNHHRRDAILRELRACSEGLASAALAARRRTMALVAGTITQLINHCENHLDHWNETIAEALASSIASISQLAEQSTNQALELDRSLASSRILVLDDDPVSIRIATAALQVLRCQIDSATDPQQAIQCANQRNYNLIVSDVMMAGMSGKQAVDAIRSQQNNQQTPAVYVTAMANFNPGKDADGYRDTVLVKPVPHPLLLLTAVVALVRNKGQGNLR